MYLASWHAALVFMDTHGVLVIHDPSQAYPKKREGRLFHLNSLSQAYLFRFRMKSKYCHCILRVKPDGHHDDTKCFIEASCIEASYVQVDIGCLEYFDFDFEPGSTLTSIQEYFYFDFLDASVGCIRGGGANAFLELHPLGSSAMLWVFMALDVHVMGATV
jgi:hypothetical protein